VHGSRQGDGAEAATTSTAARHSLDLPRREV
jgi:hypothetical protein